MHEYSASLALILREDGQVGSVRRVWRRIVEASCVIDIFLIRLQVHTWDHQYNVVTIVPPARNRSEFKQLSFFWQSKGHLFAINDCGVLRLAIQYLSDNCFMEVI